MLAWGGSEEDQNSPTPPCQTFQQMHIDSALTVQGYWVKVKLWNSCHIILCSLHNGSHFARPPRWTAVHLLFEALKRSCTAAITNMLVGTWTRYTPRCLSTLGTWVPCSMLETETRSQRGVAGYSDKLLWIRASHPVTIPTLTLFQVSSRPHLFLNQIAQSQRW